MPHSLEIISEVTDGRLPQYRQEQIRSYLKLFEGQDVHIRMGKPKRSSQANRYYWVAVIEPIRRALMEAGMEYASADVVHEYFKRKFLPVRCTEVLGEPFTLTGSTTELDSTEFFDYIESIKHSEKVLQLGIEFEDPDPSYRSYSLSELPY